MKKGNFVFLVLLVMFLGVVAIVSASSVPFVDTFDTIDPSWITDRYEPAGFESAFFDGDNRLEVTIDNSTASINRPSGLKSAFYNTQGRQRAASSAPPWCVIGDVFVSEDMVMGNNLRRTGLWARTGETGTEATAQYFILDMKRFDNDDPYDPNASNITSVWRVWDADTLEGWQILALAVEEGWHQMEIRGNGTVVDYYINGNLVYTDTTINAVYPDLTTIFVNTFNFSPENQDNGSQNYVVYWDNVGVFCAPDVIEVDIDIKPGSDSNSINPKSKGNIPVAILSTADFDAPTEVNQMTLTFGRTGDEDSLHYKGNGAPNCNAEDVNSDGRPDLVCHFKTQLAGFQQGDTEGILKGETVDGTPIEGRDSVNIVGN